VRRAAPLLVALVAVAAVLVPYAALGGGSYAPTPLADPCKTRAWRSPHGLGEALEQVALSGLDGAACDLGVSREELVLALRSDAALDSFAKERHVDKAQAEEAVKQALLRSVDDAEAADVLPSFVGGLAKGIIERVPPPLLLEALRKIGGFLR
jgi:hypothetical protein